MAHSHHRAAAFGRRTSPPRLIYAHGDRIRSVTFRGWAIGAAAGVGLAVVSWMAGTTAYFFYHDDIVEIARNYQSDMQRAYEDRIAALRMQIEDINTRRFLDQQSIETRMTQITAMQNEIAERQTRVSALMEEAAKRNVALTSPDATPEATGSISPSKPTPLFARFSSLRGTAPGRKVHLIDDDIANFETSLAAISSDQQKVIADIEDGVAERYDRLAKVARSAGASVPAPLPSASPEAMGGPFIPVSGVLERASYVDTSIDRLAAQLNQLAVLETKVRRLPVRKPFDTDAAVTSAFGTRRDPFLNRLAFHSGIDFRADRGTPVHATAAGRVIHAGRMGGYGLMVEIDHGNGMTTRYGHMSSIAVKVGDRVVPHTVVGKVGSTGRSTGPHLHYETRVDGDAVDPTRYLMAGRHLPEGS
ncbi:MAG: M23 family metallopeptidase [Flavobacteriaceae bacterium]